jgi:hypothetical protein
VRDNGLGNIAWNHQQFQVRRAAFGQPCTSAFCIWYFFRFYFPQFFSLSLSFVDARVALACSLRRRRAAQVHYPSLDAEVRVGKTYLRDFLEGGPSFVQHFDNPQRFFDLLMRRVLVHSVPQPQLAATCCQCLERLYHHHAKLLGGFDDTFVLVDLVAQSAHRPARHRLLTLIRELCLRDENTEQVGWRLSSAQL